ncbi:protein-disulfide isomerase [Pseudochelatococcus lubricantis]|uniref:Protein-disulfide isomerase n=1 Tax=Pseudochelatococcus lubricantis TaxID=1538102 RepID=A0ABX0UWE6_9HYPH|nr:DsbA family protein [Pseudochelatococcus lubricantis]NIJ57274.1 protein-disulfide isomerase [Pseudochelatococcus lubricantis]
MTTRRNVITAIAAGTAAGLFGRGGIAMAQDVSVVALAAPGPLGDVTLGADDAKVTVIEYASLTCSHCAAFHNETFAAFKEKYIDTGKVKFILREFPLDDLALLGFMLARFRGNDKFYAVTDLLFTQQGKTWAKPGDQKPLDSLLQTLRQAGITQEDFDATIKDRKLYDGIIAVRERAASEFGINATPTFFINGKRYPGALSLSDLDKAIGPLLAE